MTEPPTGPNAPPETTESHRSEPETGEAVPHGARGRITGVLILVIIGAAIAWGQWTGVQIVKSAPVNTAPPPPPAVTVARPLEREVTEWKDYTGRFSAIEYVDIRARVSGYLTEILFKDGETVRKGDPLFVIDPRPFQTDVRQAEANLARDRAQLQRATLDLKRSTELVQKNYAPQQQLDQTRAAADAGAAVVKADEALLDQARLNLEFTRVTAPVSGRIGAHQVSVGSLISGGSNANTTLLTTIVSLDPINFEFDVSESDQLAYKRAMVAGTVKSSRDSAIPVQARLADEQTWSREGRIDFVDNQLNRGSGTLRIRAVFPNADKILVPGQFARVRVPVSQPHPVLLIPDRAIVTDQARKIVMAVLPDGTITPRPIQPGPTWQGLRIIHSGLNPNDTVVIDGLMRARPGAKVTPQPGKIDPDPQAD
ncbi:MAG: efflux RND transporter periplasmic adaptor subunit [Rhodospirillaceae bacterium]